MYQKCTIEDDVIDHFIDAQDSHIAGEPEKFKYKNTLIMCVFFTKN